MLSVAGVAVMRQGTGGRWRGLFQGVLEDLEALIAMRVVCLIDLQNIGITMTGQIKLYLPANLVLDEDPANFTEKHEIDMRSTANATIECIIRSL